MDVVRRAPAGRLYYGWIMLVAVSLAQVVSWGILYYAFVAFMLPIQQELGWSQVTMSGAYSLAMLTSGIAAVPVGRWIDRHGGRALMTAGSCLATLLVVAWSQVTTVLSLYLIMTGLGIVMAMVLYEPAFAIIATWFRRQRTRALTVLTFFGAWASVIFIPLSTWLIEHLTWRSALLVLAGILAVMTIPTHALLVRRRPEDLGLLPDGRAGVAAASEQATAVERSIATKEALRDSGFWWLTLALGMCTIAGVALILHLIPFLLEQGHSPAFAATVAGLFGLMSLVGRLTIGPFAGRIAHHWIGCLLIGMQIIGIGVLATSPTAFGAIVFIALFGAGSGTLTIVRAGLLAQRYGPSHYGSISGTISLILTGARALAPLGAGALVLLSGSYDLLLWLLIGLLSIGGCGLLRISASAQLSSAEESALASPPLS